MAAKTPALMRKNKLVLLVHMAKHSALPRCQACPFVVAAMQDWVALWSQAKSGVLACDSSPVLMSTMA